MDIKHLEYIIEIAQQKNMTKSAQNLFVSQSSLSQYLSKLEAELNTPLFNRTKNEMTLTPAGVLYVESAKTVIQIKKKLYQNIKNLSGTGRISVGITSQWGLNMITNIISEYKKSFPNIILEIIEDSVPSIKRDINLGKIDFAIMSVNTLDELSVNYVVLREEEVVFALPNTHNYCLIHKNESNQIITSELEEIFKTDSFILSKKDSTIRSIADNIFKISNFSPDTVCELNSMAAIIDMVAKGVGIAFVPASCAKPNKNISYFFFSPKLYRYNVLAYRTNLVINEAENIFINYAKNYHFPEK
ncbi:LysR family transcriptional regulator [Clostridium sp. SHJSY1]|uniref:LysR family transcriptional regulator n=1 Tax=Clostridium sp. SHJSY1 TaxID=2942483 RepID=UPI002875F50B|nr:LysR family transcriptional regulator [Clostridium sp. SHJSY1]MDS0528186.1 LysR family transcriptional regulator [Clostridium sp. SHJSY1]